MLTDLLDPPKAEARVGPHKDALHLGEDAHRHLLQSRGLEGQSFACAARIELHFAPSTQTVQVLGSPLVTGAFAGSKTDYQSVFVPSGPGIPLLLTVGMFGASFIYVMVFAPIVCVRWS